MAKFVPDLGPPDVDVLELRHPPVPVGDVDALHLAVHVVLGLHQPSAVHLAGDGLAGHHVALGLQGRRGQRGGQRRGKGEDSNCVLLIIPHAGP